MEPFRLEFRAVEHLLAVAEQGSLSAAASILGLSQPALTKAIRRLEDESGATLFERSVRGVRPTAAGEALIRHARNLRATLREARQELTALRTGAAGRIRLGAGPSWQGALLPEAIIAFRSRHRDVRIQVVGGLDGALKAALRVGELDFVLAALGDAAGGEATPDLAQRRLLSDRYRVVASLAHPLRARAVIGLAELLDFPWILPQAGSYMMQRLELIFRGQGLVTPEATVETDSQVLRTALMRSGDYLAFQAEAQLAAQGVPDIFPLEVPGAIWRRDTGIITRQGVQPSPAAAGLIAAIVEVSTWRAGEGRGGG